MHLYGDITGLVLGGRILSYLLTYIHSLRFFLAKGPSSSQLTGKLRLGLREFRPGVYLINPELGEMQNQTFPVFANYTSNKNLNLAGPFLLTFDC